MNCTSTSYSFPITSWHGRSVQLVSWTLIRIYFPQGTIPSTIPWISSPAKVLIPAAETAATKIEATVAKRNMLEIMLNKWGNYNVRTLKL
ncbi:unnamed protein product [Allacma fusca]|uniref:Uncharacterized protein n=1 Tax=Allacma fusca TaxID=39272 RepID=A0A8J2Q170_9HEXA|nr:unnamed protein product [Allacma fusca]